jgi:hypothetical protein
MQGFPDIGKIDVSRKQLTCVTLRTLQPRELALQADLRDFGDFRHHPWQFLQDVLKQLT